MRPGEVVNAPELRQELVELPSLDAVAAAEKTLAAFLLSLRFVVGAGADGVARPFQLVDVLEEWPDDDKPLDPLPCATITSGSVQDGEAGFTPEILDETAGAFGGTDTVLWKTGELSIRFQVDFWAASRPEREAIAGGIKVAFSPNEIGGVWVAGVPEYYGRMVRFTILDTKRFDDGESISAHERRLEVHVLADIDEVQLRRAVPLQPKFLPVENPPG